MLYINNFFLLIIFIIILIFINMSPILINFMIVSELLWICIYCYGITNSIILDSLLYFIFTICILCLAAGESVFGLSLILFKYLLYNGNASFNVEIIKSQKSMLRFL